MYFRSIQFLRFIAALYITLFHVSYWWKYKQDALSGLFDNGYGAIDLFFVISGFVLPIVYILFTRINTYHSR